MPRLYEVTRYVRSKNAGPFWVTVDIFFTDDGAYRRHKDDPAIGPESIGNLLGVPCGLVRRFDIDGLAAIKMSFPRSQPQGGVLERDMHSGQRYVPLLDIELSDDAARTATRSSEMFSAVAGRSTERS